MGFFSELKSAIAEQAADPIVARFGPFTVSRSGRVSRGSETTPPGVRVVARVEAGSDLEKRVTATRLVAMGVFAFAAKKKRGGESWLTVEGDGVFWTHEVGRKDERDARRFAAAVNEAVASV